MFLNVFMHFISKEKEAWVSKILNKGENEN